MATIAIISSSIRTGRKSHRVALYFKKYIEERQLASVNILDLNEYKFPVFEERLKFQVSPDNKVLEFTKLITDADGVIIVTPEYNGGYPASLKNVIDLLYNEWHRKPVAISTVSDGVFGGTQVITSLQFTLWKIRAWTVPAMFPVPAVDKTFDENGIAADKESTDKKADAFVDELMWCIEAKNKMNTNS
ncbi:NADPH-dependent FMN reductase [Ferruginibacter sp.]|uniref:NADPH-dependent FMN reductase n=1 Tax=Ferruginibacter sp. TaxID=1940288 RepID=UPI0019C05B10|nr:NADPH-dependent FMN reductase [Ferruginibacter sp.]MBC7628786.1 NAD(P)H-dependent oxidoreductase [Ferruginibacter sp.]